MSVRRVCVSQSVPWPVRRAFGSMEQAATPYQRLYQEIVARAVLDACGETGVQDFERHDSTVREARIWIRMAEQEAEDYFDTAGVSLSSVRADILKVKNAYSVSRRRRVIRGE